MPNEATLEDWKAEAEKWNKLAIEERADKEAWRETARGLSDSLASTDMDVMDAQNATSAARTKWATLVKGGIVSANAYRVVYGEAPQ